MSNAVFKSVSPVQPIPFPSSEIKVFGPCASIIFPVLRITPSANGKVEPLALKYPQLFSPVAKLPPDTETLETDAQPEFIRIFSIS